MDQHEHDRICRVYWEVWDRGQSDPEYAQLQAELDRLEPVYRETLAALPRESREVLDGYLTLREHLNRRMLEFACQTLLPRQDSAPI